ncbi:RNA polymerase-associated protein LEO1-like [Parasteatoda tepidariorum]|uniref:RNA polymerase-associated protein LEO1-like n=1 Tax=Parasteatoda tepidariorum TaxID=114398 RepID=UPI001C7213BF|nr:RNA polymerase-associated protein LEO1-like [Parasteatoda tepidariorum]
MDVDNEMGSPKATAEALFGEDLDISSDEENKEKEAPNGDIATTLHDIQDQEEQEEPVPETKIELEIPRIATNLGKEVHFVKLPNFLSVDTRPYDPQWYEDEVDEDEVLDEEGRARLKLKVCISFLSMQKKNNLFLSLLNC